MKSANGKACADSKKGAKMGFDARRRGPLMGRDMRYPAKSGPFW